MTAKKGIGEDKLLLMQAVDVLKKDNQSVEGIQALKKAIEINPGLARAHQLLALHYMRALVIT